MKAHIENVEPIWLRPEPTGPCDFSPPVFCGLRVTFMMSGAKNRREEQEEQILLRAAFSANEWEIDPKRRRVTRIEGKAP